LNARNSRCSPWASWRKFTQDEGVEVVGAHPAAPGDAEGVGEAHRELVVGAGGQGPTHPQAEIVDVPDGAVAAPHLVGSLVDDLDAEGLQHRQHRGQRDAPVDEVELEATVSGVGGLRTLGTVEADGDVVGPGERVQDPEVGQPAVGGEVLLVRLTERVAEPEVLGGVGRSVQTVGPRSIFRPVEAVATCLGSKSNHLRATLEIPTKLEHINTKDVEHQY